MTRTSSTSPALLGKAAAAVAGDGEPLLDHLLVDDYQDSTLCGRGDRRGPRRAARSWSSGDPDAHVFSFQGTTDVPIRRFTERFPGAKHAELRTPHRAEAPVTIEAWTAPPHLGGARRDRARASPAPYRGGRGVERARGGRSPAGRARRIAAARAGRRRRTAHASRKRHGPHRRAGDVPLRARTAVAVGRWEGTRATRSSRS